MMRLNRILQALRELRVISRQASGAAPLQRRVAVRWLLAGKADAFDLMIRLAVLEGAAGVKHLTWATKGMAGLAAAKQHFANEASVDAEWFAPGSTGAYAAAFSKVQGLAKQVRMDPDEFINNAVFGIGLHGGKTEPRLHSAGNSLAAGILSGTESPESVMRGMGGSWVQQGALNEIKYKKRTKTKERKTEEAVQDYTETVAAPSVDRRNIWPLLAQLWLSKTEPIGAHLRALMKRSWQGWKLAPVMEQWLDESVKRGSILDSQEIQEILNKSKPVWNTNYYKPGIARVVFFLKREPKLFTEIAHRLLGFGFDVDDLDFDIAHVPPPDHISPKRLPSGTRDEPKVNILAAFRDYPEKAPF